MANFQIVALDPTTPQLRAPGASDAYTLPRPINGANINYTVTNAASTGTITAGYNGYIVLCTNTITMNLVDVTTLPIGFNCWLLNVGTGIVTVDPFGSQVIDVGYQFITLRQGEGVQIIASGSEWQTGAQKLLRGYAENFSSAQNRPTVTASPGVAIGADAQTTAAFASALGYNTRALANNSTAVGSNSSTSGAYASGNGAIALNGSYASTSDSFAASITSNSSTYGAKGTTSVAMAYRANASGSNSIAIGYTASATGFYSVALGANAAASGSGSFAFGSVWNIGYGATAGGIDSFAFGDGSRALETKKYAFAAWAIGGYRQQFGMLVLSHATTSATPVALSSSNSAASSNNQLILQAYSAHAFTGTVVARQSAGSTSTAAWKIEGLIRREGTAASTTLVASTVTVISNVPGWGLSLSADTTNGGLAVTATGAAATTIYWVGNIQTSEVISV